jgi:nitroimidazol reductase NimA-like FMN-containing flavoprotein (pyridoxamine 5'-phosphate oxidase superfamily)
MAAATDNESLGAARLDDAARDSLIQQETECVFVFSGRDGWPSGVVMSYIFADGAFWLTSVLGRGQVTGARADPRVTIVISNHGADSRQMISVRVRATLHADAATKDWFYPLFARRLNPAAPDQFQAVLDSPNRVILECRPVGAWTSHDSRRLPGDGRGGPAQA